VSPGVLVVDDSVVVRRMLARIIEQDPELRLVGTARNGKVALRRLGGEPVDLMLLDVEMPEMDGLEVLREVRRQHPEVQVLMLSNHTRRGTATAIDALTLGAVDYVPKPQASDEAEAFLRAEVLPRLRRLRPSFTGAGVEPVEIRRDRVSPHRTPQILAIGTSTGGPRALAQLFAGFPDGFPLPIVLVQHMPPDFTRQLAQRLDAVSALRVREAAGGERLCAGEAWVAPGGRHLRVVRRAGGVYLATDEEPPVHSCRPAVDPLFASVVDVYGGATLAVVLTGMGVDGCEGARRVREAGGIVIAQDRESSVVWGMPGAVVRAGLADQVVDLESICAAINESVESVKCA